MKVLYLGVYRDNSGWSHAAIDYILALDSVGIDVVPRPIKLNNQQSELPERILELEGKNPIGADFVIQHILPHYFEYTNKAKCIGMYATETSNFKNSSWSSHCNLMDGLIVFNEKSAKASVSSGVKKPLSILPHACNPAKYEKQYEKLDIPEINDKFVFYYIGEAVKRKNLEALIKAFHLEFEPDEDVSLILKAHLPGVSAEQSEHHLRNLCTEVKTNLKLRRPANYKREILITEHLSEEEICRLHATGHCFVCPSYGEAFSIPTFDAMAFGKYPIVTEKAGFDYIKHCQNGYLVNSRSEPVYGVTDTFNDLFTGDEQWRSIDVNDLRRVMREAWMDYYEDKRTKLYKETVEQHSYQTIGTDFTEILEKCVKS